jgi:hypothetical protein
VKILHARRDFPCPSKKLGFADVLMMKNIKQSSLLAVLHHNTGIDVLGADANRLNDV